MAKLPAFQFYPGDWRKDPGVQSLSYHDRGVWFEILCLMHESEIRGKLTLNGLAMPQDALCRLLGIEAQLLSKTIDMILLYGVASLCEETAALTCRRMVRDEQVRRVRSEGGFKGGLHGHKGSAFGALGGRPKNGVAKLDGKGQNKPPLKPPLPTPLKPPPSSSSSSSLDPPIVPQSEFKANIPRLYEAFGIDTPSHRDHEEIYEAWLELKAKGCTVDDLSARILTYRDKWAGFPVTRNAIFKNWHSLKPDAPKPVIVPIDDYPLDSFMENPNG